MRTSIRPTLTRIRMAQILSKIAPNSSSMKGKVCQRQADHTYPCPSSTQITTLVNNSSHQTTQLMIVTFRLQMKSRPMKSTHLKFMRGISHWTRPLGTLSEQEVVLNQIMQKMTTMEDLRLTWQKSSISFNSRHTKRIKSWASRKRSNSMGGTVWVIRADGSMFYEIRGQTKSLQFSLSLQMGNPQHNILFSIEKATFQITKISTRDPAITPRSVKPKTKILVNIRVSCPRNPPCLLQTLKICRARCLMECHWLPRFKQDWIERVDIRLRGRQIAIEEPSLQPIRNCWLKMEFKILRIPWTTKT